MRKIIDQEFVIVKQRLWNTVLRWAHRPTIRSLNNHMGYQITIDQRKALRKLKKHFDEGIRNVQLRESEQYKSVFKKLVQTTATSLRMNQVRS